jgi:hypothetical protein
MHPQQARTATATPTPAATTTAPATTSTTTQGVDNTDVATLNDALGSAGVDLRVRLAPQKAQKHARFFLFSFKLMCTHDNRQKKNVFKTPTLPKHPPTVQASPTGLVNSLSMSLSKPPSSAPPCVP